MTTVRDWRSPQRSDDYADLDYPGFAQEFLRRNPDYRRDYELTAAHAATGDLDHEQAMAELAGDLWNDTLQQDWTTAINLVADVMLQGASEA